MNTKKILQKLIQSAENRQKILNKLAQTLDPNIAYLQHAWQAAALNSGITSISTPKIVANASSVETSVDGTINTTIAETYTLYSHDTIKESMKQKLLNTFKNQIKMQKPDLEGKVTVIFK